MARSSSQRRSASPRSPSASRLRTSIRSGSARSGWVRRSCSSRERDFVEAMVGRERLRQAQEGAPVRRVSEEGQVPAALRLGEVAGVVGDAGMLGVAAGVLGRRLDQPPAVRLGIGETAFTAQRPGQPEPRLAVLRLERQHPAPVAQRQIAPAAVFREPRPGEPELERGIPGIDRRRQRRVSLVVAMRSCQGVGERDQQRCRQGS